MTRLQHPLVAFCVCLFVLQTVSSTYSQSIPELNSNQKAVISFDLRLDKMMQGGEAAGADTKAVAEIPLEGNIFQGINVSDIKRVFGATSLPGSVDQMMQMGPDSELPMEFFIRIQFVDAEACSQLTTNIENADGTRTKEAGGKTFMQPPEGESPDNIVGHQVSDDTFEFGTVNYCLQPDRMLFTEELLSTWKQVPNDAFRLAADLQSRSDLISEAVEMGKQTIPPQAGPFLDLVDNISSLVISADLEQTNLLSIVINGVDEDQAEELRSGLDSLLGLGKMGAQMQIGQMTEQMPDVANVLQEIMASLAAKRDGTTVKVIVPRPEGFFDAMTKLQNMAQGQAQAVDKMNRFRQSALAFHNYADANRAFPFDVEGRDGQSNDLSWRVRVLPYLEQQQIYSQMDVGAGPDHEKNAAFEDLMPEVYGLDGQNSDISWIDSGKKINGFADIVDGTSNTVMLLENPSGQKWLENKNLNIEEAVALVKGLQDGESLVAAFYDGSARNLTNAISEETLKKLFDPSDGQVIDDF